MTAALQICPQNASAAFPANEPGPTFTADTFHQLAPYRLRFDLTGTQTTTNNASRTRTRARPTRHERCSSTAVALPGPHDPGRPGRGGVRRAAPLTETATMIGATKVTVDYQASTAQGVQLNARLYDVLPTARR